MRALAAPQTYTQPSIVAYAGSGADIPGGVSLYSQHEGAHPQQAPLPSSPCGIQPGWPTHGVRRPSPGRIRQANDVVALNHDENVPGGAQKRLARRRLQQPGPRASLGSQHSVTNSGWKPQTTSPEPHPLGEPAALRVLLTHDNARTRRGPLKSSLGPPLGGT